MAWGERRDIHEFSYSEAMRQLTAGTSVRETHPYKTWRRITASLENPQHTRYVYDIYKTHPCVLYCTLLRIYGGRHLWKLSASWLADTLLTF